MAVCQARLAFRDSHRRFHLRQLGLRIEARGSNHVQEHIAAVPITAVLHRPPRAREASLGPLQPTLALGYNASAPLLPRGLALFTWLHLEIVPSRRAAPCALRHGTVSLAHCPTCHDLHRLFPDPNHPSLLQSGRLDTFSGCARLDMQKSRQDMPLSCKSIDINPEP